jgi:hypothetical protein
MKLVLLVSKWMTAGICLAMALAFAWQSADVGRVSSPRDGVWFGVAFLALSLTNWFSFRRFAAGIRAISTTVPPRTLLDAFNAGQIGAYLPLNVIGQSASRAMVLTTAGLPPSGVVALTLAERVVAAASVALIGIVGALAALDLIGDPVATWTRLMVGPVTFLVFLAVVSPILFGSFLSDVSRLLGGLDAGVVRWITVHSVLGHLAMIVAYLAMIRAFVDGFPLLDVASGVAFVLLLASLPVSVGGWGVREVAALAILPRFGVPADVAVIASVLLGLLAMVVAVLPIAFRWLLSTRDFAPTTAVPPPTVVRGLARPFARLTTGAIAILLFVQIEAGVLTSRVALNAADVVLGGAVMILIASRRVLARLYVRDRASLALLAPLTALVVFFCLYGYLQFGFNGWGLLNRGVGWGVILCYALIGPIVVAVSGPTSADLAVRSFLAAAFAMSVVQIAARCVMLAGSAAGLTFDHVDPIPQVVINGLMANSNAYGLLLLLAFAIWCVDEKDFAVGRSVIGPVLFPIVLATGIVLTGSRTALLIMGALIIVAAIMRRPIRTGLATASVVVLGLVVALPPLIDGSAETWTPMIDGSVAARPLMMNGSGDADLAVWGHLLHPSADEERLRSILRGLSLWASSPVLGTGIGGVDAWYRAAGLQPLVIHNVLVWFLAETGLVGTGIAIVSLALLLRRAVGALAEGGTRIAAARLIVVVAVFSAASMIHDFFYQRGFWFVLGCLMTAMASVRRSRTKVRS